MVVEGEGADVAFLVAGLLLETLLEFTVLLEAVLLGHGGFLLLGLHHAALASELLEFALEDGVFAELALQ